MTAERKYFKLSTMEPFSKAIPEASALARVDQTALDTIIHKHAMFLRGQRGGARASLKYKDLSNLDFRCADMRQADFTGSRLSYANLSGSIFNSCNFFAADLRHSNMRKTDCTRADLRGAYLAGANLTGANLSGADLREGKIMMRGSEGELVDRLRPGSGSNTILSGAKLTGANLTKAQAYGADFSDADLSGAILVAADLTRCQFTDANLADADLTGSILTEASMKGAIIRGMSMMQTEHAGLDLSGTMQDNQLGKRLESLGRSLAELLTDHKAWVNSGGQNGQQLDLSGYDLRDVVDLKSHPLTAIRALNASFIAQDLRRADLQSGVFDHSDFRDCQFGSADLRGSSFKNANFARADFSAAKLAALSFKIRDKPERLQRTDFSGANLRYAILGQADLRHAILMGADLTGAILTGCDLSHADLSGAILSGAVLKNAKLEDTIIDLRGV